MTILKSVLLNTLTIIQVENVSASEIWKEYCRGVREQQYFVSNYGRVKTRYHGNGKETLKKTVLREWIISCWYLFT